MTIMAFGTGMQIQLGYFNAGWIGRWVAVTPHPWRFLLLEARRPAWNSLPVTQSQWEER